MSPAATPVPRASRAMSRSPRRSAAPRAAAFRSFSTVTGTPPRRADSSGPIAILGAQPAHLHVLGCVPGAAQVHRPQVLAVVESDGDPGRLVVQISEQLELDHTAGQAGLGDPPPGPFVVGCEVRVAQRVLQLRGVHGAACDLQVDLHVDVGRAGMRQRSVRAQQVRDQAAEQDELGAGAVVVHDAHEGELGGRAGLLGAWWFLIAHACFLSRRSHTCSRCSAASSPRTPAARRSTNTRGHGAQRTPSILSTRFAVRGAGNASRLRRPPLTGSAPITRAATASSATEPASTNTRSGATVVKKGAMTAEASAPVAAHPMPASSRRGARCRSSVTGSRHRTPTVNLVRLDGWAAAAWVYSSRNSRRLVSLRPELRPRAAFAASRPRG